MIFEKAEIDKLNGLLDGESKRVLLLVHYNPDGDAVGSAICLKRLFSDCGHSVEIVAPNRFPDFMNWMPGAKDIIVFRDQEDRARKVITEAEAIVLVDFNLINRLEGIEEVIEQNSSAVRVLIDHHLQPPTGFDITFSFPESCSTAYLLYEIICQAGRSQSIDRDMATCLYVGMMTDTGNFSFSNLTAGLFRAVAYLVERGIDIPEINRSIYNTYSRDRIRLMGHCLYRRMVFMDEYDAAYIVLSEADMRKYNFKQGDSEGFVNIPLSIDGMKMSALFTETHNNIRISLRSRGDIDVNQFARKYFDGGGHKNAAGARSTDSLLKTVDRFEKAVAEFLGGK